LQEHEYVEGLREIVVVDVSPQAPKPRLTADASEFQREISSDIVKTHRKVKRRWRRRDRLFNRRQARVSRRSIGGRRLRRRGGSTNKARAPDRPSDDPDLAGRRSG
jgi:hypothetical protein